MQMADETAGPKGEPVDLEALSLAAFGNSVNPRSVGAVAVARRAIFFAALEKGGGIAIDEHAIIQAILSDTQRGRRNAATWMYNFIQNSVSTVVGYLNPRYDSDEIERAVRNGGRPNLNVLAQNALGRAGWIARLTVGRDACDLRHLVMALLHEPGIDWLDFGINLSRQGVVNARKAIVDEIVKRPEKGEQVDIWQQLIDTPPAQITPIEPPTPPLRESLPIHTDDPARVDQLGRHDFANILSDRIIEAHKRVQDSAAALPDEDDDRAFIVHMHGPWGSGKSTVLNFIRTRLQGETPPWLVVEFNAWRSQRIAPPWWSLILAVQKAALRRKGLSFIERRWLALRWHWMRARADYMPMLKGFALLGLAVLSAIILFAEVEATQVPASEREKNPTAQPITGEGNQPTQQTATVKGAAATRTTLTSTKEGGTKSKTEKSIFSAKELLASIAALGTAIASILAFGRSLLFGGGGAARAYESLQADPYTPMMTLFTRLVRAIDQPIIVFVDDLDRCERAYVCELLENVQTMLRAAPITYLIAADRKWITTSFEKRYADFSGLSTDAGRPLGYQFLDKLFQVSVTLPAIPASLREQFWDGLLRPATANPPSVPTLSDSDIYSKAQEVAAKAKTHEDVQAAAKAESDPRIQRAIRAEGARKLASSEGQAQTEHRLKSFGALIEANPRAMKRLANAVSMNLARAQIEGRDEVSFEGVARWTIIELRWPLLADWLAENPARISGRVNEDDPWGLDQDIQKLLQDKRIKAVIGGARDKGRLTAKSLADMLI